MIKHHSPSSLNLFCAAPAMYVLERILGHRQPVGAPAHRGSAVEDGVTAGLTDLQRPLQDCIEAAFRRYDHDTALSPDPRREQYRETIPTMVETALDELRPYGKPSKCQGFVEWKPEGLKLPIIGYFDYMWDDFGIIVDLKTTEKLPSSIKTPHARQVSLYAARTGDNVKARLAYVTPKKRATYELENVRAHLHALHQIALRVERFLSLSDDPQFFASVTVPDVESFYWTAPAARQKAFEVWGI